MKKGNLKQYSNNVRKAFLNLCVIHDFSSQLILFVAADTQIQSYKNKIPKHIKYIDKRVLNEKLEMEKDVY